MGHVNFLIDQETDATVSVISKLSKLHRKQVLPKIVELGSKIMIRDLGKKNENGILISQIFQNLLSLEDLDKFKQKYD